MSIRAIVRSAIGVLLALSVAGCPSSEETGSGTGDDLDGGRRELPNFPGSDTDRGDDSDAPPLDATRDASVDSPADTGLDVPDTRNDPDVATDEPDRTTDEPDLDVACQALPTACAVQAASTRCQDDLLVVCAADADGCFVESLINCAAAGDECVVEDAGAECRPPDISPGDGDTCAEPIAITPGVYAFNTTIYANDYDDFSECGSLLNDMNGPDVVLAIALENGQTLTVSAESSDTDFDITAAISDGCPAIESSCLDFSDESIFINPEVVSVTNSTGSSRVYYIVLGGDFASDAGVLTVTVSVS